MIQIRALQHYLYCPHRWGMLYLEGLWQDNYSTVGSTLNHVNVHTDRMSHINPGKVCCSGVTVYSEKLGIYGKTDMLEFIRSGAALYVKALGGNYVLNLIEYKPTASKAPRDTAARADIVQLYAQYCCVKELFACDVNPYIFYINTHRRVKIDFADEDYQTLLNVIAEICNCEKSGIVPKSMYGEKCRGCSMLDICMPQSCPASFKGKVFDAVWMGNV
ncbi:MAG: CRISPR-associated protein Cas4 [Bacteroidales bacterium]|nr:CRISPR-associated protein Cas4 [Bacteroidales bacterium]